MTECTERQQKGEQRRKDVKKKLKKDAAVKPECKRNEVTLEGWHTEAFAYEDFTRIVIYTRRATKRESRRRLRSRMGENKKFEEYYAEQARTCACQWMQKSVPWHSFRKAAELLVLPATETPFSVIPGDIYRWRGNGDDEEMTTFNILRYTQNEV